MFSIFSKYIFVSWIDFPAIIESFWYPPPKLRIFYPLFEIKTRLKKVSAIKKLIQNYLEKALIGTYAEKLIFIYHYLETKTKHLYFLLGPSPLLRALTSIPVSVVSLFPILILFYQDIFIFFIIMFCYMIKNFKTYVKKVSISKQG